MLFAQVENVEFQSHISECKLHNSILAVDDRIRGGQEWSSKNNRYIVSSHCYWFHVKNNKIYRIVEFVHLYQTSSTVPFGIFMDLSARDSVMVVGFNSPKPSFLYIE